MKTIVWLAIILTGIAIAITGVALFACQEYRLVGNYGAYSISVRARSPDLLTGFGLTIVRVL